MDYIITFKNTSSAVKAEQCLLEQTINVGVMPLPPQVRAGCGICLRICENEIKQALEVLADMNINEIELFSRVSISGHFAYTEIKDRSELL